MYINEYGDTKNPKIILLAPMMVSGSDLYELMSPHLKGEYFIIAPEAGILTTVTILMGLGFFFMSRKGIWIPCILLSVVWTAHMIYFLFFVKTIKRKAIKEGE